MKKFEEYAIEAITAIALCDAEDEDCRQQALLVTTELESGEVSQMVVFGWDMPNDNEEWLAMCADSSAWESLSAEHHIEGGNAK